jgi:mannonate dehydratase
VRRATRRATLAAGALGLVGLALARRALPRWLACGPLRPVEQLSSAAQELVHVARTGLDLSRVWDAHVHAAGAGDESSACWVHPDLRSPWHPWRNLQYDCYRAATGMDEPGSSDATYVQRVLALQRAANPAGRALFLALDWAVDEAGREEPERTTLFVPNELVLAAARAHRELVPCASIHPYRIDAVERLRAAHAQGARAVKWLPNAQGIDLLAPRCAPFLSALAQLDLPLFVHAGEELAVAESGGAELGNPLRARAALGLGVRVILAHCASLGSASDLDHGGRAATAFELFLRLMGEPRWQGRLFGDLSAVTLVNREPEVLRELLRRGELHSRLVFGSDYPLPAVDPLFSAARLARAELLEDDEVGALEELQEANPLLFALVLARRVRVRGAAGESRLAQAAFETAGLFGG